MKALLFSGSCLLLASCADVPANSRFQFVRGNFYRDKSGRLFERRESVADEGATFYTWYDSTVAVQKASGPVAMPLSDVLDLASYQELGHSLFSKDKRHVYYSYANSGGGFRAVVSGADPVTFRASPDYQYGFDAAHGYYCDHQLPGLRVRRRQLLYGDTVAHFVAYVKDDQRVFYQNEPVPGADAATFHLVRGRAWEAEDRHHRYRYGGQQLP